MKIICNNKIIEIEKNTNLPELLRILKYRNSVSVFINGKQLLASETDSYIFNENDNVKIIRILGGG